MIDVFGTLGPSCESEEVLTAMFAEGMTGIRINLSHVMLSDCKEQIGRIHAAAEKTGVTPKILIDMQGPELRIGDLESPLILNEGERLILGKGGVPLDDRIVKEIKPNTQILLDDGKLLVEACEVQPESCVTKVLRGGMLSSRKSIALEGAQVKMPVMTERDIENIKVAKAYGITGIMQPFVRSREDLLQVKGVLKENHCEDLKVYAKIENQSGVEHLKTFLDVCDEVIIARGDLGNSMPLWELPKVQKQISKACQDAKKPFMVVTQMLSSMEHSKVPTRAEVSDIYNAALDGAASVMVTGETAVGEYPEEVIRYLRKTVDMV